MPKPSMLRHEPGCSRALDLQAPHRSKGPAEQTQQKTGSARLPLGETPALLGTAKTCGVGQCPLLLCKCAPSPLLDREACAWAGDRDETKLGFMQKQAKVSAKVGKGGKHWIALLSKLRIDEKIGILKKKITNESFEGSGKYEGNLLLWMKPRLVKIHLLKFLKNGKHNKTMMLLPFK
jgi:hypothetical protein